MTVQTIVFSTQIMIVITVINYLFYKNYNEKTTFKIAIIFNVLK